MKTEEKKIQNAVLELVAERPEVTIDELQVGIAKRLGLAVDRHETARVLRTLQDHGIGRLYLGRRGHKTRFVVEDTPEPKQVDAEMKAVQLLVKAGWKLSKRAGS